MSQDTNARADELNDDELESVAGGCTDKLPTNGPTDTLPTIPTLPTFGDYPLVS